MKEKAPGYKSVQRISGGYFYDEAVSRQLVVHRHRTFRYRFVLRGPRISRRADQLWFFDRNCH